MCSEERSGSERNARASISPIRIVGTAPHVFGPCWLACHPVLGDVLCPVGLAMSRSI